MPNDFPNWLINGSDLKLTITDSPTYGLGWLEHDGRFIEEVRESATQRVIARSVNGVVEFDERGPKEQ